MNNFDDLLDDVLREETTIEAGPGMEQRILARVREEGRRGWYLPRIDWLAGASLAACLVVAVAVHPWRRGIHDAPLPSARTASIPSAPPNVSPQVETSDVSAANVSPHPRGRKIVSVRAEAVRPAEVRDGREPSPKLDTFPAVTQRDVPLVRSPKAIEALQELKAGQEKPVEISAIVIQPL